MWARQQTKFVSGGMGGARILNLGAQIENFQIEKFSKKICVLYILSNN
jgi:hypothetical protein